MQCRIRPHKQTRGIHAERSLTALWEFVLRQEFRFIVKVMIVAVYHGNLEFCARVLAMMKMAPSIC